ncbi:hypothetical protein A4X03_0g8624 [Tilletia caries]|uniref:Uncharacterized protein n=1 Tax=Tilletia caries TaxID=13290 RepID=A0A8T8SGY9_9BASI|nr:hypothetical protein A4X03_0g8624 [Tilletia caries]
MEYRSRLLSPRAVASFGETRNELILAVARHYDAANAIGEAVDVMDILRHAQLLAAKDCHHEGAEQQQQQQPADGHGGEMLPQQPADGDGDGGGGAEPHHQPVVMAEDEEHQAMAPGPVAEGEDESEDEEWEGGTTADGDSTESEEEGDSFEEEILGIAEEDKANEMASDVITHCATGSRHWPTGASEPTGAAVAAEGAAGAAEAAGAAGAAAAAAAARAGAAAAAAAARAGAAEEEDSGGQGPEGHSEEEGSGGQGPEGHGPSRPGASSAQASPSASRAGARGAPVVGPPADVITIEESSDDEDPVPSPRKRLQGDDRRSPSKRTKKSFGVGVANVYDSDAGN